jgi:hypothetical protein
MEISRRNALHVNIEAGSVVSRDEILAGIEKAKEMMADAGIDSEVTYEDLLSWCDSELPVPEIAIGDIVVDPLLLVHEMTEIDEIMKLGLELTKDALGKDPEKVAAARLRAMAMELDVARHFKAVGHIRRRLEDLEARAKDNALTEDVRKGYSRLRTASKETLEALEKAGRQSSR